MKILHTSDWHLDAVTCGMRRIGDLERAVRRTVQIAGEQRVDAYVFHGDLADPDCGSILVRVLAIAIEAARDLSSQGISNIWIAGNHDVIEDGGGISTLNPLGNLTPHTRVAEKPMILSDLGVELVLLPFPSRTRLYDPDRYLRDNPPRVGQRRAVLGHCTGLDGVQMGSESRDMSRGAELSFPLAACFEHGVALMANGHFHKQQLTDGGVWIPGALERLRFDEEGHTPGILITEV